MARPEKEIDWDKFNLYLKAGSSQIRIAKSLSLSVDTLQRQVRKKYGVDYAVYAAALCSTGELLLEATQFQKALAGNITMLTWLGKVRLGQREPELLSSIPPAQLDLDKDHLIMELQHRISLLEASGNKPETE